MFLLVDAGNTRVKWAFADSSGKLFEQGDFRMDSDALPLRLPHSLELVLVSSVASDAINAQLRNMFTQMGAQRVQFVDVQERWLGVRNHYRNLQNLGVDRWVAALGASSLYPQDNLVVIDAGTAVTVDLLIYQSESGEHHFKGGAILPGFRLMHDALTGRTAKIVSEVEKVASVVGADTMECVNSGAQYGLAGGVDRVVNEMRSMVAREPKLLVCGGDARQLADLVENRLEMTPDLIFTGLQSFLPTTVVN